MKTTFKTLFYLLLLTGLSFTAKAQSAVPDTVRIGIGVEGVLPNGDFGKSYSYGIGGSLRVDIPITKKWYVTANAGYTSFKSASDAATTNPQAIANIPSPNFETIPLKLGIKYFLIKNFYVQGEAGETLLANKSKVYAVYNSSFTYSPQIGMLFTLKKHTYIDAGVRYEALSSFYNDNGKTNFWAAHITYSFNL